MGEIRKQFDSGTLDSEARTAPYTPTPDGVLITAVSPFEDLPGYQYYSLLLNDPRYKIDIADDNDSALTILRTTGAQIHRLTHPGADRDRFLSEVSSIARGLNSRLIIPGADAHLFALAAAARHDSWLRDRCPSAAWLADRGIEDKCHLQEWIGGFLPVPKYRRSSLGELNSELDSSHHFPIMIKGMHKGAAKCESRDELTSAARAILRNPANGNNGERLYLEECIEGEEHCLLLLNVGSDFPWTIGLRKLATTQTGTTLAAIVEHGLFDRAIVERIARELIPGMAIELEWRGAGNKARIFEVNMRFPSWIGALGSFGHSMLTASTELFMGRTPTAPCSRPEPASVIYRLPQSGYLSPEVAFNPVRSTPSLLWPSASPHQFLVK